MWIARLLRKYQKEIGEELDKNILLTLFFACKREGDRAKQRSGE
jgi:hypothetical protein